MSDLLKEKDDLLEAVKAPTRKKSPSNNSLWLAIIAADVIFGVLDIGSGLTVYWVTKIWFYGVLVFLAGILPLLLHQKLFTRAYASDEQKKIAIVGGILAVVSILGIGILAGIANVRGVTGGNSELMVVLAIVVLAFIHAGLLTYYFYADPGIQADQTVAQTIARAVRQGQQIEAGDYILEITKRSVDRRKAIGSKHGSPSALREILNQLHWDENQNGIPDFMERQYAATVKPPVNAPTKAQDEQKFYTAGEWSEVTGIPVSAVPKRFPTYQDFAAFTAPKFDNISGKNMKAIYREAGGVMDPTAPAQSRGNHR